MTWCLTLGRPVCGRTFGAHAAKVLMSRHAVSRHAVSRHGIVRREAGVAAWNGRRVVKFTAAQSTQNSAVVGRIRNEGIGSMPGAMTPRSEPKRWFSKE